MPQEQLHSELFGAESDDDEEVTSTQGEMPEGNRKAETSEPVPADICEVSAEQKERLLEYAIAPPDQTLLTYRRIILGSKEADRIPLILGMICYVISAVLQILARVSV